MKAKRAAPAREQPLPPLTPTEEQALNILSRYRYMTALDMAYALSRPKSLTRVRSMLTALAGGTDYQERQLLYRVPLPSSKTGNRERVYTLGAAGREVVEKLGIPADWYYRPSKTERLSGSHLAHQLFVTRFVAAAHWWGSRQSEYTLSELRLSYDIEKHIASRAGGNETASAIIPDGWLLFERVADGARSPLLVEMDRGSEYQERLKNHVRSRLAFIRSGDYARLFGVPAVMIAYVTTGQVPSYRETRVKTMAAWTREVLAELKMERWAGLFRFAPVVYETLYEDAHTLFEKPVWYRPDSPTPLSLFES